jgi:hypothetical protein
MTDQPGRAKPATPASRPATSTLAPKDKGVTEPGPHARRLGEHQMGASKLSQAAVFAQCTWLCG